MVAQFVPFDTASVTDAPGCPVPRTKPFDTPPSTVGGASTATVISSDKVESPVTTTRSVTTEEFGSDVEGQDHWVLPSGVTMHSGSPPLGESSCTSDDGSRVPETVVVELPMNAPADGLVITGWGVCRVVGDGVGDGVAVVSAPLSEVGAANACAGTPIDIMTTANVTRSRSAPRSIRAREGDGAEAIDLHEVRGPTTPI